METTQPPISQAFYIQAVISFGVAMTGLVAAVLFLPLDLWARGFLGMTALFLVSSTFSLAKVVRDRQESAYVGNRLDQARIDKLIAEHDPFKQVA